MRKQKIVKAWKDEKFRESLDAGDQALLPENPAGFIDLTDAELESVNGGAALTGSSPSECACIKTQTGTGAGCSCTCPDEPVTAL
jgi:mersacidin/lichenicidin family type 2 lantibiotic